MSKTPSKKPLKTLPKTSQRFKTPSIRIDKNLDLNVRPGECFTETTYFNLLHDSAHFGVYINKIHLIIVEI
jgi:hypothetical protein